jgi:hypothetical protein
MSAHPVGSHAPARAQGPPSEGSFIRALRDHALFSVNPGILGPVRGLAQAELEEHSDFSRPSVTGLLDRFRPVLHGQSDDGTPLPVEEATRWAIDPDAGVVVAVQLADKAYVGVSDLYGRIKEAPVPQEADMTLDETVDGAVGEIKKLLEGRSVDDVVGVGVSLAGPRRPAGGTASCRGRQRQRDRFEMGRLAINEGARTPNTTARLGRGAFPCRQRRQPQRPRRVHLGGGAIISPWRPRALYECRVFRVVARNRRWAYPRATASGNYGNRRQW